MIFFYKAFDKAHVSRTSFVNGSNRLARGIDVSWDRDNARVHSHPGRALVQAEVSLEGKLVR